MSEPGLTYIFERGNRIPYWQDFLPRVGVPHGVEFRLVDRASDGRLRLRAPGYGEPGNYGCGAITVKEMDIVPPLKDEVQADYAEAGSGWREQNHPKSWAELALFEKLDHLRGRIVALEVHRIAQEAEKRAEPTWTAAYKSGALRGILERLERIEQAQVDELTREPGWSVSVAELARLRRVEEAARAVDADFDAAREMQVTIDRDWRQVAADRSNLRAALDSEPKR